MYSRNYAGDSVTQMFAGTRFRAARITSCLPTELVGDTQLV